MTDTFVIQVADALGDIWAREATGALRISVDHGTRMAFFEGGALVYYASDLAEESLGTALTQPGRLDSPEARSAVASIEAHASKKQALVAQVLEQGLAEAQRLRFWLVEYAFECFARAFDARTGTVRFTERIRAVHPLPYCVPVPTLLLEAVRRMKNEWVIREAVGSLDYTTEPAADHAERLEALPLSFYDGLVASQVTRKMPLSELVAITGLPEGDVLRAILALRLSGVLDPFAAPKAQTNSGRLRMRQAALDSGIKVDVEAAAVALTMAVRGDASAAEATESGAISMGEMTGATSYAPPATPSESEPEAHHAPPEPTKKRGNTAQLNLLSSAYKQMAEAEIEAGNLPGAMQYYESALRQNPQSLEILLGLAKLLIERLDRQSSGESMLERACAAHPESIAPRIALARLMRSTGRHTKADELLREARRINPDDATVNAMLARRDEKQGGFFARLRGGGHDRSDAQKEEPFASAPRAKLQAVPETSDSGRLVARRCRHCGNMARAGAAACTRCGATI